MLGDVTIGNWPNSVTYTFSVVTHTNTWPNQVLEPLYSWSNNLNGSPSGISSTYPNLQEGREIYFNTAKPDYAPYSFPHPLVLLDGSSTNNPTGGGTNNVPTNSLPTPPTGLKAIPIGR